MKRLAADLENLLHVPEYLVPHLDCSQTAMIDPRESAQNRLELQAEDPRSC